MRYNLLDIFAGRPLKPDEYSGTYNTIQLPHIVQVVKGKFKKIFDTYNWIGDEEYPEWERAEEFLIESGIKEVWSPVSIRVGSILLGSGEQPESIDPVDGTIYRHEGIDDTKGGSTPENGLGNIKVRRFVEKIPASQKKV